MIDRLCFAAITICLFIGTALAVVGTPFGSQPGAENFAQAREVQLPHVLVVGKRDLPTRAPARTVARTEAAEPHAQHAQ